MAARVVVPAEQDHGHHLQNTKELLLKAACRERPLAQGVSGCASVVGMCKGTPRTQSVQPELPWSPRSPASYAFRDCGPKMIQQKAYSALV